MSRFTKKGLLAALGTLAVVAIGGLAYAYWTGSGTGTGTGTVGTSGSVVLSGSVASGIAPGTSEPVSLTAANSSSAATQVTTVHLVSVTADAGHGACATADFSMADVTENHQVPAGATVDPLPNAGTLAYANTAVSQDGCKGATLTLTLSST
jgi:hypothetical protein